MPAKTALATTAADVSSATEAKSPGSCGTQPELSDRNTVTAYVNERIMGAVLC
jgi:hypothetical protein